MHMHIAHFLDNAHVHALRWIYHHCLNKCSQIAYMNEINIFS